MKDYLRLLRVGNLALIAMAQLLVYLLVVAPIVSSTGLPFHLPYWQLASLVVATVLIAAGGFIINDYFDIKIDTINRPDRVIVSRSISKPDAMRIYQIFTVAGVAIGVVTAVFLKSLTLAFIFIIVAGLLWFYSSAYKRTLIVGNLIASLTAAMVPLVPAFAAKELLVLKYEEVILELPIVSSIYTYCCAFALLTFLLVFALEIIKDIDSVDGDRELECHTIPVVWGVRTARIIATALVVVAAGLAVFGSLNTGLLYDSITVFPLSLRYALTAIALPVCLLVYLIWARNCRALTAAAVLTKVIIALTALYSVMFYYIINKM